MMNESIVNNGAMSSGIWDLLARSGYFTLAGKCPDDFTETKGKFFELADKSNWMNDLLCQVSWSSERGVEATISLTKIYDGTWLGHQLAKRPDKLDGLDQGVILRDIYQTSFEHPGKEDAGFKWIICYIEPTVRWMERCHMKFAEKHLSDDSCYMRPLIFMNGKCDVEDNVWDIDTHITVELATDNEISDLSNCIMTWEHPSYAESLNFTHSTIRLNQISNQYHSHGIERERGVFVAKRNGKVLGFSVLEIGQQGINTFRLLDSMRIFRMSDDFFEYIDCPVELIRHARQWYKDRDRKEFIYICEDGDTRFIKEAKLHKESEPCLWIMAAKHVPSFLEHIREITTKK